MSGTLEQPLDLCGALQAFGLISANIIARIALAERGVQGGWEGTGVALGCGPDSPSLFRAGVDLPPRSASSLVASKETSQTTSQSGV